MGVSESPLSRFCLSFGSRDSVCVRASLCFLRALDSDPSQCRSRRQRRYVAAPHVFRMSSFKEKVNMEGARRAIFRMMAGRLMWSWSFWSEFCGLVCLASCDYSAAHCILLELKRVHKHDINLHKDNDVAVVYIRITDTRDLFWKSHHIPALGGVFHCFSSKATNAVPRH